MTDLYIEVDAKNVEVSGNGTHGTVKLKFLVNDEDMLAAVDAAEEIEDD